ncbi:MAG TPA: imidazole glycerol phosphate synthase subunit HisH [Actinomycetota bacterium]|nr:imidazole glycerol phosphate synthase subunit HisH [Actinomycetota bacterium]
MRPRIGVLDYGMGNLRSVARALERVGAAVEVTDDPDVVGAAAGLVVPGVGAFGACMRNLSSRGLEGPLRAFVAGGRPVFGVCLGMQVLFERSEEDPEPGLGLLPGACRRLPSTVKVPHMGWNEVRWARPHPYAAGIPDGTRFYFVHSYAPDVADGVTVGVAEHGRPFAAAVARGNVFATQFHPEKSGEPGLALYEAFVREAGS